MTGVHVKQHRTLRAEGQAPSQRWLVRGAFGALRMVDSALRGQGMNSPANFTLKANLAAQVVKTGYTNFKELGGSLSTPRWEWSSRCSENASNPACGQFNG
jgi:hypothetical protein